MKKALLKIAAVFVAVFALETTASAQGFFERVPFRGAIGTENWTQGWADFTPENNVYPGDAGYSGPATTKVIISSDITTNTTWTANNWYELTGAIHVTNNATLTIEAGTVIRGIADTTNRNNVPFLLVARGAKIVANGTASNPIIMTSGFAPNQRTRGDWAGLLIMGNAGINSNVNGGTLPARTRQFEALPDDPLAVYGGGVNFNDNDSSGVLRYVRVEYAGFAYLPNRELNSITFGGVGRRTVVENVMCSYGRDDSFEWFGGTCNGKRLIAFAGTDDDFDCDEGHRGNIQFALAVRHPRVWETDATGSSNGLEIDNNTGLGGSGQVVPGINDPQPVTRAIFSNLTVIGPLKATETSSALATGQRFSRAVQLRTLTETNIFNSVIAGYATGLDLNHPNATITPSIHNKALNDSLTIRNTIVLATSRSARVTSNNVPAGVTFNAANWFMTAGWGNDTLTGSADLAINLGMVAPYYTGASNAAFADISFANVNYGLSANSILASGASFEHPRLRALVTSISENVISKGSLAVFPNPAADVANIRFDLKADAAVSVVLTDMAGKQVRSIAPQVLNAGVASVSVPTAGLKAGLYIATLTVNGQSTSLKLSVK